MQLTFPIAQLRKADGIAILDGVEHLHYKFDVSLRESHKRFPPVGLIRVLIPNDSTTNSVRHWGIWIPD